MHYMGRMRGFGRTTHMSFKVGTMALKSRHEPNLGLGGSLHPQSKDKIICILTMNDLFN